MKEDELACATKRYESDLKQIVAVVQSREAELNGAIAELNQDHEARMNEATSLLNQHRGLLHRMHEECRNSVDVCKRELDIYIMEYFTGRLEARHPGRPCCGHLITLTGLRGLTSNTDHFTKKMVCCLGFNLGSHTARAVYQ